VTAPASAPATGTASGPVTGPAAASAAPTPEAVRTRLVRRWTRARWIVAVGAAVLVSGLVIAIATFTGTVTPLDPESTGQAGSRALAQILRAQGVDVVKVTRSTELARRVDGGSTLVVVNPALLGPEQLERVADAGAGEVVLVTPNANTLGVLAPDTEVAGIEETRVLGPGGDCRDPGAAVAGEVAAGSHLYRADAADTRADVCYPYPGADGAGSYLVVTGADDRRLRIVGQSRILQNQYLADDGNAALALRTLGARDSLVWYVPDPLEVSDAGAPPTLPSLVPDWVRLVGVQLVIAALVALVWRARRLGRLVPEPLPVVVRAAETEEGRARLYRQAGARGRAAATLRTAALRRLASRLAVPSGATPEQVAAVAAETLGRPGPEVHDVLLGPSPADDGALVALADELDTIERQVAGRPAGRKRQP
jgi:hypothetical protein